MPDTAAIRCYQETSVTTIGPEKLVVMLYEGLLRNLQQARAALVSRDLPAKGRSLGNAQAIVCELRNALDHAVGGALAANLEALYTYVFVECLEAVVDGDPRHMDNCVRVVAPLADAWARIPAGTAARAREEMAQAGAAAPAAGPIPARQAPPPPRLPAVAAGEAPPPTGGVGSTLSIAV